MGRDAFAISSRRFVPGWRAAMAPLLDRRGNAAT